VRARAGEARRGRGVVDGRARVTVKRGYRGNRGWMGRVLMSREP
jgi:hypothetical protein